MALEDALLDILVCPIDKRGLLYFADQAVLYNPRLRWLYQIEEGVPVMLAGQAVPASEQEHERLMACARRGEVTAITAGQSDILAGD
jgi:uncharacterized protein YbaR (Trm112 family)